MLETVCALAYMRLLGLVWQDFEHPVMGITM